MNQSQTDIESKYGKYWTPEGLHRVPVSRILGFTLNNVATNMFLFLMTFVSYYLNGFVGVGVMLAGSFATIMRVWDGVTDPIIGFLVDKTNGKFGKNRPLMLIVAACTDKIATMSAVSAVTVVLYGVVAGNYALSGGMSLYTSIAAAVFCVVGAGVIATRFGQKKALVIGSIGGLAANGLCALLWLFGDPTTLALPGFEGFHGFTFFTVALFILTILISGFKGISGNIVLPMIADCSDYEVYRSGRYVPGMMGTIFSFVDKVVSAVSPMIASLCFAMIGFTQAMPDVATPYTPALKYAAVFLMYGMVFLGLIFNLIAMKYYSLTKEKMEEVQEEIAAIKARDSETESCREESSNEIH